MRWTQAKVIQVSQTVGLGLIQTVAAVVTSELFKESPQIRSPLTVPDAPVAMVALVWVHTVTTTYKLTVQSEPAVIAFGQQTPTTSVV